jgi:hypothetical protein
MAKKNVMRNNEHKNNFVEVWGGGEGDCNREKRTIRD